MRLNLLDQTIVIASMLISVLIAIYGGRRSSNSSSEFFLSGRSMPWWLLGVSMVATTFSTDTPNLVTGLTRTNGVPGNWSWWAFLLTSMLTAFFFAHLWRRSGVTTDMEFYELRYSGTAAAFLRAFRGIYVGIMINVIIMGAVTLAAVKFGSVLLGISPLRCVVIAGTTTVIFAAFGGLRGVVLSDFFLFLLAMVGSITAAVVAVNHPQVGGLSSLFQHPNVQGRASFLPSLSDGSSVLTVLIMPLFVQWWSVWYPGAEPGGGGFVAQRMLAAKDEKNSIGAILLFNLAHYALRPWPWILVALASLVVYPDLDSLRRAFPGVDPSVINEDFAYAAMLTFLPHGWLGVIVASLVAAYISTIATSLNLGSSYVVNDLYHRFVRKTASEREKVLVGRIASVVLMVLAGLVALSLKSAVQAFNILLSVGAGTGLLFVLRWYVPRISAWSEIAAMIISFAVSLSMQFTSLSVLPDWLRLSIAVAATTVGWVAVTFLTPGTSEEVTRDFYRRVRPPGGAWRKVAADLGMGERHASERSRVGYAFLCMASGCALVYGLLFAVGAFVRTDVRLGLVLAGGAAAAAAICAWGWHRLTRPLPGDINEGVCKGWIA